MKNTPDIRSLLDRYWEGETTLEEERRLKAFFSNDNIPEDLLREAALFRAFRAEQAVLMPKTVRTVKTSWYFWQLSVAAAVVALLLVVGYWQWQKQPEPVAALRKPFEKTVPAEPVMIPVVDQKETANSVERVPDIPQKKRYAHRPGPFVTPAEDTCENPEQALAEIRAALALVSSKINKGKQTLDKGLKEVEHMDILIK
ncbi:MAG: hypothetical protein ACKVU2_05985 [Saprospiraceae bacterium]